MPTKVRLALGLMWLMWAVGAIRLLSAWLVVIRLGLPNATPLGIMYISVLVLQVILIRAVTSGRNWARVTYSGLAVLAIGLIVLEWFFGGLTSATQLLISAGIVILYSTVLVLLFHSSSATWFNKSGGLAPQ